MSGDDRPGYIDGFVRLLALVRARPRSCAELVRLSGSKEATILRCMRAAEGEGLVSRDCTGPSQHGWPWIWCEHAPAVDERVRDWLAQMPAEYRR